PEAGDGIVQSSELQQEAGAIVDRLGGARLNRDGSSDQTLGFVDLAGLIAQDSEGVQRLEMLGVGSQDIAVDFRRLGKAARTAQAKRIVERRITTHRLASLKMPSPRSRLRQQIASTA